MKENCLQKTLQKNQDNSAAGQRTYSHDATEAAFLLGGIGTGNFSVGARGELKDWEIFNQPAKGQVLPYSFFSVWAKKDGAEPITRVLEAKRVLPYSASHGFSPYDASGFPRLESSSMRGEYPFVWVNFQDSELPVRISMEAFTPFIPLNANDSGIPGAIIRYKVRNISDRNVSITVAASLANGVGFDGYDAFGAPKMLAKNENVFKEEPGMRGLYYTSPSLPAEHLQNGTMAIITTNPNVTYKREWLLGSWYDGAQDFWDDFSSDGLLSPESAFSAEGGENMRSILSVGSLGVTSELAQGEEAVFEFILCWNFPNRMKAWGGVLWETEQRGNLIEKNYYSTCFSDAWAAGSYLVKNMVRLEKLTRDFHRALFTSTLPWYVIDAVASNITVIRSCTCFRISDGTFLGWEGCFDRQGCCEGNCTHVWNYEQTLGFLFPELEQSMRKTEFALETGDDGNMAFRSRQVFGEKKWDYYPAADGQLGCIVRLYRDWKLSGNDDLLKSLWGNAKKALDFADGYWDKDGDGVLESQQHNTYDIAFYGPNSMVNSIYFAALKAAAEIELYLGNESQAEHYQAKFHAGSKRMDEYLWNGEFYIQQINDVNNYRYQYGNGCLSDQILGQLLAHVAGLGYILPKEHVQSAIKSVYDNNFKRHLESHTNAARTFALNDESGLLLCTWPNGGRPKLPFIYCDEVWTGIEYQVAAHLIFEGFLQEGLAIVQAVRERYDGYRRNPWDEVECGHHYVRSLSSWAILVAITGFGFSMHTGSISFKPSIYADNFRTFFSTGKSWGIYNQTTDASGNIVSNIDVLYGESNLSVSTVHDF